MYSDKVGIVLFMNDGKPLREKNKKGRSRGGLQIGNLSDRFNVLRHLPRKALKSDDLSYLISPLSGFPVPQATRRVASARQPLDVLVEFRWISNQRLFALKKRFVLVASICKPPLRHVRLLRCNKPLGCHCRPNWPLRSHSADRSPKRSLPIRWSGGRRSFAACTKLNCVTGQSRHSALVSPIYSGLLTVP